MSWFIYPRYLISKLREAESVSKRLHFVILEISLSWCVILTSSPTESFVSSVKGWIDISVGASGVFINKQRSQANVLKDFLLYPRHIDGLQCKECFRLGKLFSIISAFDPRKKKINIGRNSELIYRRQNRQVRVDCLPRVVKKSLVSIKWNQGLPLGRVDWALTSRTVY